MDNMSMYPRDDMNTPFFVHSWFLCQYNQGGSLIHPLWAMTAAWLAQLGERRSAEREVAGSNPGRTNTQGL